MVLSGVAAATETDTTPITLSATFTSGIAAVCPEEASYDVTIQQLTVGNKSGGDYMTEYLRPDLNMNTGNSWTLSFTLTNESSSTITLNSVNFDSFIFNGSGKKHEDDDILRQARFTLTLADSSGNILLGSSDVTFTSSTIYDTDADTVITITSPMEVEAGKSVQFNLTVGRDNLTNAGAFVGLKGVTFNGETAAIPEPTTATLSLLALAGLAARRRRK